MPTAQKNEIDELLLAQAVQGLAGAGFNPIGSESMPEDSEPVAVAMLDTAVMTYGEYRRLISKLSDGVRNTTGTLLHDEAPLPFACALQAVLGGTAAYTAAKHDTAIGPLVISPCRRAAFVHGIQLPLTNIEFNLLEYIAEHTGMPITRQQLLLAVWNAPNTASNTVESHIKSLRRKLGPCASYIKTVYKVGYVFSGEGNTIG